MLHKYNLGGLSKYVNNGIYIGGIKEARDFIECGLATPKDFKFFFNHCGKYNVNFLLVVSDSFNGIFIEWAPGVLENEIKSGRWDVVRVPAELVLKQSNHPTLWYTFINHKFSHKN